MFKYIQKHKRSFNLILPILVLAFLGYLFIGTSTSSAAGLPLNFSYKYNANNGNPQLTIVDNNQAQGGETETYFPISLSGNKATFSSDQNGGAQADQIVISDICTPSKGQYSGSSKAQAITISEYGAAQNTYTTQGGFPGGVNDPTCQSGAAANPASAQKVTIHAIYEDGLSQGQKLGPVTFTVVSGSTTLSTITLPAVTVVSTGNTQLDGTSSKTIPAPSGTATYNVCATSGPTLSCQTLAASSFSGPISLTFTQVDTNTNALATSTATTNPQASAQDCQSEGGPFSYIICAAINGVEDAEQYLINVVDALLVTNPVNFSASSTCSDSSQNSNCTGNDIVSAATYQVWSNFRVYGNILLVIALLIIVFAEAIGGGIGEAYTVKKMLPRILAAAILINLSIYIVVALEDITNILGSAIQSFIVSPFQHASAVNSSSVILQGNLGTPTALLGAAGIAVAGATEGFFGILLLVVSAFVLAALGVLITLMFRQGILVLLVVVSPVAFALFCLPNTEQYFRKWWDLLLKTLLVYPIVKVVFAIAQITGIVMSNFGIKPTYLATVMALLAGIAPLFLIPFAFKLSGGAIGGVHNAVSGVKDRLKEPLANARKQNRANRLERARNGNLFRGEGAMARRASSLAQGTMFASKAGLRPGRMRANILAARSAHTTAAAAKAGESVAASSVLGNDDLLNASLHGNGTEADARAYLQNLGQTGRELDQNVASINQARRDMGRDAFNDAAVVANAGTGTGYGGGPADMLNAINRVAGGDRARAARLLAGARGQAERARRTDLYGAGFANSADQMTQLHNGHTNDAQVNDVLTDEAVMTKSAGEIGTSRNNSLNNLMPAMQRRLIAAQAGVADAVQNPNVADARGNVGHTKLLAAQRLQKQALAGVANALDAASQSSAENAVDMADGVMAGASTRYETQAVNGVNTQVAVTETVGQTVERYRTDPEFQQMRREYGSGYAADAAGRAAQMAQGGAAAADADAAAQQGPL